MKQRAINLKIPVEKIFHIPSDVDIDRFKQISKNKIQIFKRKYKIDKNKKILGFVGFGQADLGIIIDGFSIINKKRKDVILLIVGPLEKRWQEKIDKHPFKNKIIITGKIPSKQIPELTSIIDICYLPLKATPTNRGRNPIKFGDYIAAGKPVIANPVGDIAQVIEKHKIGLCIKYSAEDVADKTLYLLNKPGLIKKFGHNARKNAEKFFNWKTLAEKLNEKYNMMYVKKYKVNL